MSKTLVIILAVAGTIGLGVWGIYAFLIMMSGMELIPIRTERLEGLSKPRFINLIAPSSQDHIHALFLEITGNVNDGGVLTLNYNDTIIYKTITLPQGDIRFMYDGGDWYSTNCLLKFVPNSDTTQGHLKIDYKFYGE